MTERWTVGIQVRHVDEDKKLVVGVKICDIDQFGYWRIKLMVWSTEC